MAMTLKRSRGWEISQNKVVSLKTNKMIFPFLTEKIPRGEPVELLLVGHQQENTNQIWDGRPKVTAPTKKVFKTPSYGRTKGQRGGKQAGQRQKGRK